MSKKIRFGGPFDKQRGKRAETLLKCGRQYLHHIYWSLLRKLSWKKSLLVLRKILGWFGDTLTVDDKGSLLNKDNLTQPIQAQLSQKQKNFRAFFFLIYEIQIKFSTLSKKRWSSYLMYLWNYALQKPGLDKRLKRPVSKNPSKNNMVNGPKHCWNLKNSFFTIFIDCSEEKGVWKILS